MAIQVEFDGLTFRVDTAEELAHVLAACNTVPMDARRTRTLDLAKAAVAALGDGATSRAVLEWMVAHGWQTQTRSRWVVMYQALRRAGFHLKMGVWLAAPEPAREALGLAAEEKP